MSQSLDGLPLQQRKPLRISTDLPLFTRHSSGSSSGSSSPTNRNTTPGTTPSTGIPQCFFHVLCMHDFESSDPDHLPFHKDEVLTIIKQDHSGWWAAMRSQGDRIGWIPSSFVSPLNRNKVLEHPDETLALWPYKSFSDHPLSAVHDPCVPVSEECTALSFRLVTPTDPVLYKGFFDDRARNGPFSSLPDDERSPDMEDVCVPPTPQSPIPYRIQRLHPPNPLLSVSGALHLARPASPRLCDMALYNHPDPCRADGQTSLTCLSTPVNPNQDISDIRSLDLTIWVPDNLAKQLCVLMHTLYASIRQNDCLDWIKGRRNTELTGLRHFSETHNHITSWVRKSILADDDATRQTETLDFWIRVAEKCHSFRNFDSLCAIIFALSRSSSIGSAWTRCAHKQTFATLRDMLDVTNESYCFMDAMNAARGPSVPFVRGYLERICELQPEHSDNHQSGHASDASSRVAPCKMQLAMISTMLRHQSLPYDFKITKSIRSFIDDEWEAFD